MVPETYSMFTDEAAILRNRRPRQEAWVAIQRVVAETLTERLAGEDAVLTRQEAGFLADHVADDLMAIEPSIPEKYWVNEP